MKEIVLFLLGLIIFLFAGSELINNVRYFIQGYGAVGLSGIGRSGSLKLVKPGYANLGERLWLFGYMLLIDGVAVFLGIKIMFELVSMNR